MFFWNAFLTWFPLCKRHLYSSQFSSCELRLMLTQPLQVSFG
jgi:hypothetical protein